MMYFTPLKSHFLQQIELTLKQVLIWNTCQGLINLKANPL